MLTHPPIAVRAPSGTGKGSGGGSRATAILGCAGDVAEWLRQRPAKPCTRVQFPASPPVIPTPDLLTQAQGSVVSRVVSGSRTVRGDAVRVDSTTPSRDDAFGQDDLAWLPPARRLDASAKCEERLHVSDRTVRSSANDRDRGFGPRDRTVSMWTVPRLLPCRFGTGPEGVRRLVGGSALRRGSVTSKQGS